MNAPPFVLTQSAYKPRFRVRQYPALKIYMVYLYICAGVAFISMIVCLAALVTGTTAIAVSDLKAGAGAGMFSVIAGLIIVLVHAGWIIAFLLPAELIKVALDVQANTQEAAFNSRQ